MSETKTTENFSFQSLVNDAIEAEQDNREDYEQTTWHPSALGSCLTGAYLQRVEGLQKEFDTRTLRVFKVGKQHEEWIEELLEKKEIDFEREVRIEIPEWNVSGRVDVVVNGEMPIELKSKHSRAFWHMNKKNKGPNEHHKMQLWTYLKALDLPEGRIVYISKDDLSILEYPVFLNDEELAEKVEHEFSILNRALEEQLPPKPVEDKKDWRYKYCNLHEEHCLQQDNYLEYERN